MNELRVALVTIVKKENLYLREFVEHYLSIGIDKIIILDNNDVDGEYPSDVLQDYENIDIISCRGEKVAQLRAYNTAYQRYNKQFDWLCFFDCDEFLYLNKHGNIKEFLSDPRFNGFNSISVNWKLYGDNGLIRYDGRPLKERFTEPLPFDKQVNYMFPENYHIKSIVSGDITMLNWVNPHFATGVGSVCNASGKRCENGPFVPYDYTYAELRHYRTKTLEEFLNIRMKRGRADAGPEHYYTLENDFFRHNEKSEDKIKFLQDYYTGKIQPMSI